jgi:hypothetical protein
MIQTFERYQRGNKQTVEVRGTLVKRGLMSPPGQGPIHHPTKKGGHCGGHLHCAPRRGRGRQEAAVRPRRITQDDYDKKARELKEKQAEFALRIEQHQQGDGEYRTTLESLISLASRAAELFERSKTDQKRQLIAFIFSNLQLRGKKLEFSLRSPFDLMVDRRSYTGWLGFLNTVRTERFEQVLALRASLLAIATAAHG